MAINPSLFAMLGQGFQSDQYAIDGNHLRWMFDPRLGFPRFAFCVESRPSVRTREGAGNLIRRADLRTPAGTPAGTHPALSVNGILVTRPGRTFEQTSDGIALTKDAIVLTFQGNDSHACWASLRLAVRSPGASVTVEARYRNRGQPETVDRVSRRWGLGRGPVAEDLKDLHELLAHPESSSRRPVLDDRNLEMLYRRLVGIDAGRFSRVTYEWLQKVAAQLVRFGVATKDIGPDLSVVVIVDLVVDAARIDDIAVSGTRANLQAITWVRTEELMAARDWKPLGCFPAATRERDYVERNVSQLGGVDIDALAKDRVLGGGPVGVEPLDEPVVPPTRPATNEEKARRYLDPWLTPPGTVARSSAK